MKPSSVTSKTHHTLAVSTCITLVGVQNGTRSSTQRMYLESPDEEHIPMVLIDGDHVTTHAIHSIQILIWHDNKIGSQWNRWRLLLDFHRTHVLLWGMKSTLSLPPVI